MIKKSKFTYENFRLEVFVTALLRNAFKLTPQYDDALNRAKRKIIVYSKHGKPMERNAHECAHCHRIFQDKHVETIKHDDGTTEKVKTKRVVAVDHIDPVVALDRDMDPYYSMLVARLYCGVENLQVLCNYPGKRDGVIACHKIKTKIENAKLAAYRKAKKK
jgi:hypothetical protein